MLLRPESEQFNPGKVFMFFSETKKYGNLAASDGKFTAAAYIVSNHIDNDFQQSYTEKPILRNCSYQIFFRSHRESPCFGSGTECGFP